MSQEEQDSFAIYLKYKTLEDMLKVILFSARSALGITPMLYHITYNNQQILFIQTGAAVGGGIIVHYIVQSEKSSKKFIELKGLTGEFVFVDRIGTDTQSLYIPILELQKSTFRFPT
jgi:hypothetical protein